MSDPPPLTTIGGHQVLSSLHTGGMGEVLLARKQGAHGFEKLVAIKTIRADMRGREELRAMFLDEARLAARLHHPTIAQVYDFGEQENLLYIVMEYVEGVSFVTVAKQLGRPFPPRVAVRAMIEVCRGLHSAHEASDHTGRKLGVVHRDVSPHNLMLTYEGSVKIIDFGIARMTDRVTPMTRAGMIKGKPGYMAPEQLESIAVDRRTDVFLAGIVLHELLTGHRLFDSESIMALAYAIAHHVIEPPSSKLEQGLPVLLDDAVMRALQRDPAERFPTALAMATALEQGLADIPGESLEQFTQRELAPLRQKHHEHMQALLEATTDPPSPQPRPKEHPTLSLAMDQAAPEPAGEVAEQLAGAAAIATASAQIPNTLVRQPRVGLRLALIAGLTAALGAGGLMVWLLLFGPRPSEPAPKPAPPLSTGPVDAKVTAPGPNPETASRSGEVAIPQDVAVKKSKRPLTRRAKSKRKRRARPTESSRSSLAVTPGPVGTGYVTVFADPWANVRIDGQLVGHTPLDDHPLAAGHHTVELVDPASRKTRYKRSVTIQNGARIRIKIP